MIELQIHSCTYAFLFDYTKYFLQNVAAELHVFSLLVSKHAACLYPCLPAVNIKSILL